MRILAAILLLVSIAWSVPVRAAMEIEPNNDPGQATLVDPRQPIEGHIDDPVDYFRVVLAGDGRVDVRLVGYPDGTRVRAEIFGFSESDSEKLASADNRGRRQLAFTYAAQERAGVVRLEFEQERRCERNWCAIRLNKQGPWYVVARGLDPVPEWLGSELLAPPTYQLTLRQPKHSEPDDDHAPGIPDSYQTFTDPDSGLGFRYPPGWQLAAGRQAHSWRLTPPAGAGHAMGIELKLVARIEVPGSSAEKQLNLLEKDFSDHGAEIRQRSRMEVAGSDAPYLVLLQATAAGPKARLQLVIPLGDYYLHAGYAGPQPDYPKAIKAFETLLNSIELSGSRL
ncbi:MAG: hypothetical protein Tsb0017_15160 [Geothermobacteraceae bacterium]